MTIARRARAIALLAAISCRGEEAREQLVDTSLPAAVSGDIAVTRVVVPAPPNVGSLDAATMAVYATIANRGTAADTLIAVETPGARAASLHANMDHGGTMMMMPTDAVAVPAGATLRLAPGETHVMLEGLARQFAPGDSVTLALVFRRAGRVPVTASVVAYDQLESAIAP